MKIPNTLQMIDAWGGSSLFQVLLQTLNKVASKHDVSISTVAVKYILDQVKSFIRVCSIISVCDNSVWSSY